ncbi:hypothetical protein [Aeromonas enteropelogenes]
MKGWLPGCHAPVSVKHVGMGAVVFKFLMFLFVFVAWVNDDRDDTQ